MRHPTEADRDRAATRQAALTILRRGEATLAEIAELAGVSRQAVRLWAVAAGIKAPEVRAKRLAKLWAQRTI